MLVSIMQYFSVFCVMIMSECEETSVYFCCCSSSFHPPNINIALFLVLLWNEKEEANNPNIWHFRKIFVVSLMSVYCDVRVSFYVDFRFFGLQIFSVYFGTFMPHGRLIHRSMFVCLCCYGVNFVVDFDPINVRTSKR